MADPINPANRVSITEYLKNTFVLENLKTLTFNLGLDFYAFPHQDTESFGLGLLRYFENQNNLGYFLSEAVKLRKDPVITALLSQLPSFETRQKIQYTLDTNLITSKFDIPKKLVAVLNSGNREVQLVATTTDNTQVLVGVSDSELDGLLKANLGNDREYKVSNITVFSQLSLDSQYNWLEAARRGWTDWTEKGQMVILLLGGLTKVEGLPDSSPPASAQTTPPQAQTLIQTSPPTKVEGLLNSNPAASAQTPPAGILHENPTIPTEEIKPRLLQLYSRGLIGVAAHKDILILDGSSDSDVQTVLKKALADRSSRSNLWPENDYKKLFLTASKKADFIPIVAVLAGGSAEGDSQEKDAVLHCVRKGWPILVMKASGGLADKIQIQRQEVEIYRDQLTKFNKQQAEKAQAANQTQTTRQKKVTAVSAKVEGEVQATPPVENPVYPFINDVAMAEIVEYDNLNFIWLGDTPENFERKIQEINEKGAEDQLLVLAWQRKDSYSFNANRYHNGFWWQQLTVIVLGIIIVFFATLQTLFNNLLPNTVFNIPLLPNNWNVPVNLLTGPLRFLLLLLPVVLAILLAGINRFNPGKKWITLRAATEAVKREIYYYRTQTGIYSPQKLFDNTGDSRKVIFSHSLESINKRWVEGNLDYGALLSAPPKPQPPTDQVKVFKKNKPKPPVKTDLSSNKAEPQAMLYSDMSADDYINARLKHQLNFYQTRIKKYARLLAVLQWLIIIFSGIASLLTALGWEVTITLTATIATGLTTFLEYNQVFNISRQYNHAVNSLNDIYSWWIALEDKQKDPDNINKLVDFTESVVQSEQGGWVQQMQTALTDLREQQTKKGEGGGTVSDNINNAADSGTPVGTNSGSQPQPTAAEAPSQSHNGAHEAHAVGVAVLSKDMADHPAGSPGTGGSADGGQG